MRRFLLFCFFIIWTLHLFSEDFDYALYSEKNIFWQYGVRMTSRQFANSFPVNVKKRIIYRTPKEQYVFHRFNYGMVPDDYTVFYKEKDPGNHCVYQWAYKKVPVQSFYDVIVYEQFREPASIMINNEKKLLFCIKEADGTLRLGSDTDRGKKIYVTTNIIDNHHIWYGQDYPNRALNKYSKLGALLYLFSLCQKKQIAINEEFYDEIQIQKDTLKYLKGQLSSGDLSPADVTCVKDSYTKLKEDLITKITIQNKLNKGLHKISLYIIRESFAFFFILTNTSGEMLKRRFFTRLKGSSDESELSAYDFIYENFEIISRNFSKSRKIIMENTKKLNTYTIKRYVGTYL